MERTELGETGEWIISGCRFEDGSRRRTITYTKGFFQDQVAITMSGIVYDKLLKLMQSNEEIELWDHGEKQSHSS